MMPVRFKEHHQPLKMVLDHRKCPLMMKSKIIFLKNHHKVVKIIKEIASPRLQRQ